MLWGSLPGIEQDKAGNRGIVEVVNHVSYH